MNLYYHADAAAIKDQKNKQIGGSDKKIQEMLRRKKGLKGKKEMNKNKMFKKKNLD